MKNWLLGLVLVAPLLSGATWAAADGDPGSRILVTGQGSAQLKPDMAVLNLTVTREGKTARAALDANSAAMAEVLAAMKKAGIEERDLQTSNFNIQPRYAQSPRQAGGERPPPRIVAYTVRNSLSVRVREIGRVGEVLDTSVTLGVNEGGNILFT
ncbi:MAG: SIMPL domain-containing protein, partial [Halioglobus sp.]|nr:SIMPL domain-containing protein [Halioglobus sp.]